MSDRQRPIPMTPVPPSTPCVPPAPWWVTARRVLAVATGLVGVLSALVEVLQRAGLLGRP